MKLETSWVSPPQSIGGLDHLGTQAPCILIYSQLLPGITNVTDRARYYSFYTWLIWSFDQRYAKNDAAHFIEMFRRADCLFTLIAERHAHVTDRDNERHGVAMVGRIQLVSALDRLENDQPLILSEYTAQDSPHRYFKNPMGGLSQYYAGTLADLHLMDSSTKPWMKYTKERGAPLARKVDAAVPGDRFWATVEADVVTVADLDALSDFCPCKLASSKDERKALTAIFFDTEAAYGEEGMQRRRSLALIQQFANAYPKDYEFSEWLFRACAYSGALTGGESWDVSIPLESTKEHWAIYVRNDLLSVACQAVWAQSLRELQPQAVDSWHFFKSAESFASRFVVRPDIAMAIRKMGAATFVELLEQMRKQAPNLQDWESDAHEVKITEDILDTWKAGETADVLVPKLLRLLATLAVRDDPGKPAYGSMAISPEALSDYPINLLSFRKRVADWQSMALEDMFSDLVVWCLNTHLRVALRKLRQTGRSTFHLRPTERGLEVVGTDIPPPSYTTPRFRQAVQILRDIGVFTRDESSEFRLTRLSDDGEKLMEAASA
jgi:hypothetical protein